MNATIFWLAALLSLYCAYALFWGVVSAKMAKTADDFLLGGRQIPSWVFASSATAISFSGWIALGHPAFIFRDGFQFGAMTLSVISIPLSGVLFLKRQWMIGRHFGFSTQAGILGDYYRSEALRWAVILVALTFAVPFLAMQLAASGYLVQIATGNAISWVWAMWIMTAGVFLYVCLGGLRAAAFVGALQFLLFIAGIIAVGLVAYSSLGGFGEFVDLLAKLSVKGMGPLGEPAAGYNAYFEVPGVIQFIDGLGKEAPVGGLWTGAMALTFSLALMGIQASPGYAGWALAARDARGFGAQQVWVSGLGVGVVLLFFGIAQGMGANFLGASAATTAAGLEVSHWLPVLDHGRESTLVAHYIQPVGQYSPWMMVLLVICSFASIHALAAALASVAGTIFVRDIYVRYLVPDASDAQQKLWARITIFVVMLAALLLATYAPRAQVELGSLALGLGAQLLPALLGLCWMPWLTGAAVTTGAIAGMVGVILTDSFGQTLATFFGFDFPWGRWPWTIHSAGWGLFFNALFCLVISTVSQRTQDKLHRQSYHAFLRSTAAAQPAKRFLRPVAWTLALAWGFFAVGPGSVIGNYLFSMPDGSVSDWALGLPSIWVWQIIWWGFGILVIWFLGFRLEMATAPRAALEPKKEPQQGGTRYFRD